MHLGEVLRKYRIFSERTLRDLSKEIGCSPATLLRIEQLHHADSRTIGKIMVWLFKEVKK